MRIGTAAAANLSLSYIQATYERITTVSEQLSSGEKNASVSDDPAAASQALSLRNTLDKIAQYSTNANSAENYLSATDSALSSLNTSLQSARSIAVQGASDTLDSTDRAALVTQIDSIIDQIASVGNTTYGSRYILGGQRTTSEPFIKDDSGAWQYTGGTDSAGDADLTVSVGPNQKMVTNVTGDDVISGALSALVSLKNNLASGDSTAISETDLAALDDAIDVETQARGTVGGRINQLQDLQTSYTTATNEYTSVLSDVSDTDIATATVALKSAELSYSAALEVTNIQFNTSLLDYIS
jgi:flagellar hook-associated protein 3 FlgL